MRVERFSTRLITTSLPGWHARQHEWSSVNTTFERPKLYKRSHSNRGQAASRATALNHRPERHRPLRDVPQRRPQTSQMYRVLAQRTKTGMVPGLLGASRPDGIWYAARHDAVQRSSLCSIVRQPLSWSLAVGPLPGSARGLSVPTVSTWPTVVASRTIPACRPAGAR